MRISVTKERVGPGTRQWPSSRTHAGARVVPSMACKLWNLTYVVKAGRCFVWLLLRLTDLHELANRKKGTWRVVKMGGVSQNYIAF